MTGIGQVLARIVAALDAAGVPYMIAGSLASTHYALPRSTFDIDIVIKPDRASLTSFVEGLAPDSYYVDMSTALEAFRLQRQFNVIDMATGWKVDLIIRRDRPFSVEEFRRRVSSEMFGVSIYVATAEDTVVAKLEWARIGGGSERQLRDVREIVDARGDMLDRAYVIRWVDALGLRDEWTRATSAH